MARLSDTKGKCLVGIARCILTLVTAWSCSFAHAQLQSTELAVSRRAEDGALIKYAATLDGIKNDSKVLLVIMPSNLRPATSTSLASTPDAPNTTLTEPAHYPITRSRARLLEAGFALAWLVMPANVGIASNVATDPRFLSDMEDVFASLKRQYPQMQRISVGTEGLAMANAMLAMRGSKSVDGQLVLAPFWQRIREEKLEQGSSANTLVIHDSSNQCYFASLVETKEYLQRTGWKSVAYRADKASDAGVCGAGSSYLMLGIDAHLPSLLQDWLQKKPLPTTAGAVTEAAGLKERAILASGKQGKLEITLLLPPTPGPHPVVIFNHGDMVMDFPWVKYRQRYVDIQVATPLLRQGYAVAMPARPGVGRSEGTYRYSQYAINDGDPSYKARTHAVAVMDAIAALRQDSDLDMKRFVLAGQSAGGDTVMYMATQAIDGLRGVINYAGGRSNHAEGQNPTFENKMMIQGWSELGAQAKVPVQLVFAENDSRYSANTIRKSHEAFNAAGGKAQLLLVPPLAGDGHFINSQPNIWRKTVLDFLGEVLK
jgi:dienelactone hydrolase